MLGLGSSLMQAAYQGPLQVYTSNFTVAEALDGWGQWTSGDTQTIESAQNAPGESGDDWLKVTWGATPTSSTGIKSVNLLSDDRKAGDYATITCKIYLVDDGGKWDNSEGGGSEDVTTRWHFVGRNTPNSGANTAVDELVDLSITTLPALGDGSDRDVSLIFFTQTPIEGAVMYIKDIVIQVYRP